MPRTSLQKMSDAPLTVCPACGASAFTKQVTAAGFQLKGSGWYVTDFRAAPGRAADKPASMATPPSREPAAAKPADGREDRNQDRAKSDGAPAPKSRTTPSASA
jgi:putative FmdB family regulatory protein